MTPPEYGAEIAPLAVARRVLPPPPPRLVPPSAASVAAEYIRTLIFEGVLREGDRIGYDDIADRLEMSRQPVREAILELERDGVVVSKPKRGTFVGEFDERTVREHHAIYGLLEGHAARQVASDRDPQVFGRLRDLWKQTKTAATSAERVAIISHFLGVIDTAGSNARLRALLRQISQFVPKSYYAEHFPNRDDTKSVKRILDAIAAADPDAAAEAVAMLWLDTADDLVEHLYKTGVFTRQAVMR